MSKKKKRKKKGSVAGGVFRFRKNDMLGAAGAEEDGDLLEQCFVDTGDLAVLEDQGNSRQIVVGRTGAGKTALLVALERKHAGRVIVIDPEQLALTHVSNSTILQFFSDIGVNLDPFFKLLWRHVLAVEVLSRHFSIKSEEDQKTLWTRIKQSIIGDSRDEKEAKEALDYLEKWGDKFWEETEFRVKEITRKIEEDLGAELGGRIGSKSVGVDAKLRGGMKFSEEERVELKSRGQSVVTGAQVQVLTKVIKLVDKVLTNKQHGFYIVIDRLDEQWVEDRVRYKLIMALLLTARDFLKIENAKVIISLRKDLLDRVFRLTRDSGFQQEKYESRYLRLHWSRDAIMEVLDKRVEALVKRTYTGNPVSYLDLFPRKVDSRQIADYIYARADRPRAVIDFGNKCILAATDKPQVSVHDLRKAEGEYSKSRLRALADEWSVDHPNLPVYCEVLHGLSSSVRLSNIPKAKVEECCLRIAAYSEPGTSPSIHVGRSQLDVAALALVESNTSLDEFLRVFAKTLYKVGIVGLKTRSTEAVSWSDDLGQSVSSSEVTLDTRIEIHPTFYRVFGVRPSK